MFSRGSKNNGRDTRPEAPSGKAVPSIISADLSVAGDMVSTGEIQVDGLVQGDIQCSSLVVGVKGSVTGHVTAESVRLHGKVTGLLKARTVFLASTAHMVGDITHESLAIEPGAFMEGHCRRMTEENPVVSLVEAETTPLAGKLGKPELVSASTRPVASGDEQKKGEAAAAAG